MRGKGEVGGFRTCILAAALISMIIVELVPFHFNPQPASGSPDSYTDPNLPYLTFTVDGGTFVGRTISSDKSGNIYFFVTPSQGEIKITANTQTTPDWGDGSGILSCFLGDLAVSKDRSTVLNRNTASAGMPIYLSGSVTIGNLLTDVSINVDFFNKDTGAEHGGTVDMWFFAKPTITDFEVNATTVNANDAARVYGQVIPYDYAGDVYINYTRLGQTGRSVSAESAVSTGSFADTFVAGNYPAGQWTATALANASEDTLAGSYLKLLKGFPRDLLVASKSVSFTSTGQTTSQGTGLTTSQGNQQTQGSATISAVYGTVKVRRSGSTTWVPATPNMVLGPGDIISTGASDADRVEVKYQNCLFKISKNTNVASSFDFGFDSDFLNNVMGLEGDIEVKELPVLGPSLPLQITTPQAVVKDKDTEFEVLVDDSGTTVYTFNGTVQVSDLNETTTVDVGENQTCTVPNGSVPSTPTTFDPATVDQWWTSLPAPSSPLPFSASATPEAPTSLFAGLMLLIIIGIIAVIAVAVGVKRAKIGKPQGASQPVPYQAQQQSVYSCPHCGSPLIFIPQYQRYYCQKENRYI